MRRSRLWRQLALPIVCAISLVAGLATAFVLVTDSQRDWRLASYTQTDLDDTMNAIAKVQREVAAVQADTVAVRAVPSLSQVEELAWQFGLATRRAERATTTSKERRTTALYTVALCGPATDLVAYLHSLETQYLCRLSQATLQKPDETGRAVLTVSLEVAQ